MIISRLKLTNWRNFTEVDVPLRDRVFIIGPNASGKSNLLDARRYPLSPRHSQARRGWVTGSSTAKGRGEASP